MWPQQGYYLQGWPGQQYANTVTPSQQQQSNPSDWAAKAQQWAQQRQIANQYYQQQQQPQQQQQQQQQVGQWPHQQPQHQQQQPYYTQQQQQASTHQQPHIHQQSHPQQAYGTGVGMAQQSHLQQQQQQVSLHQQQLQTSVYQQSQQGGVALSSGLAAQQHQQQSHSLLSTPIGGGLGGVASGQGQLTMQAERPSASFSGSNPSAQPEPLFPQRNAPPASSQALALSSHAHQPHPPQSQQQYGSPVLQQKQSLLGDSSHTPTNVSSSPHSASAVSDGLLGRSPGLLKPHALLESLQPTVRPKSPANVPMSLDSGRYGPMRGNMRPPFRPQGVEERERDLRFQKRGTGISEPPRPHPPTERSQGQGNYNEWDQGPPQSRGEIPTGPRAPTEEMFSEPKQEEQFDHHQQQHQDDQQQHFGEHPFKAEPEYKWQSNEEGRQGELAHNFQRSTQEQEWGVYGSGQNRASEHLKIDKENIRGPSPYGHHQFPYNERGDAITSSPAVSISSLKSDEPTISSLRKDAITAIPGLGGGFEEQEKDAAKSAESSSITGPQSTQQVAKGGEGGEGTGTAGGNQANQMIKSLGKFVSQLQTLKGLTSSLQLLQALPKGGNGEEEAKRVEPAKPKESSEAELSEETKRKVAALLATESDSDGEQGADDVHRGPESRPRRDDYHPPSQEMAAREFDGTFDVKPQVYGTYGSENDYPPQQHARDRDGQRDYAPIDYRDHPDPRARFQPPARKELEGYRPPPRDYFPPRDDHEQGYRRDYPPHREPPPPERGYDYRQAPPHAPSYDRERDRDYDRGPPPAHSERMYEPPPHERDYPPPPSHYRSRSPPPVGGGYERQTRAREGTDPYYDIPGRETGVAMETERMMDLDHREHPADDELGATERIGSISSKLQSFDYSHGSANLKTVDYNHGTASSAPSHPAAQAFQDSAYSSSFGYRGAGSEAGYSYEGYQYPVGGGGYPPVAGSFLPSGLDAATLFAAYASQAGESKRKALPSWLREELEKMERKKRKEMEKEALEKARLEGEREQRAAWRDELDSGDEEEDRRRERSSSRRREDREAERERERERGRGHSDRESRHRNIRPHHSSKSRSRSPYRAGSESPPPTKRHREEPPEEDEEDKQIAMIMKIRKTLTEVLLEVTNQEVLDVVLETLDEERNPKMKFTMKPVSKPKPFASEKSVLAGLSMYDSDVSDTEPDADPSKARPVLDPQAIAEAFKDTKPPSSSKGSGSSSSSKEKENKQSSSSHRSGSSLTKHSSSSGSSSSKREKSSSSKSEKSSSSSSKSSSKKSSSSSKKDTDDHHSSSSSKHSKSESKNSSSSKSSSSKSGSSKSSSSTSGDKDSKSKSKHSSSSSSSKSQSKRSPSPHRRSSSTSKQKDTESSSKSSSSKSSHKSESKSSSRRRSSSLSPSSSGRKHSRRHRSRSRSRSRSPGHGTGSSSAGGGGSGGGGGSKKTSLSSRMSPQRSTPGSYRHVEIRD